jgi:hypothetical protein
MARRPLDRTPLPDGVRLDALLHSHPSSSQPETVLTLTARLASRRSLIFAHACQVLVYGSDADATIADRGGYPFD